MKIFKKQWLILTAIFSLIVGYLAPVAQVVSADEGYITVAEAIENNSGTATVKGYIVGTTKDTDSYQQEGTFTQATNLAIADAANETDPSKIMPVQLPKGAVRTALNLVDNPQNLGKEVYLTGTLTAYFSEPGLKNVSEYSFDGSIPENPPVEGVEGLKINQIQGNGHDSPYKEQNVVGVEGIVTFVEDINNFYIQDPNPDENPNTSEGILVYKKNHGVKVGDHVSVSGQVKEWVIAGYDDMLKTDLATTEINADRGTVEVIASNQELPAPLVIGEDITPPTQIIDNDQFAEFDPEQDGIDFYESIEGMLVAVENPIAVGPQKYGELPVIAEKVAGKTYTTPGGLPLQEDNSNPERLHLLFDDNNFVAKIGDQFNGTVTGVVTYTFQNFKILTDKNSLPKLIESDYKPEVAELAKDEDKLSIATYNMENYHAGETEKTEKISKSIVNNLNSPDILGLVEVQDNDGPTDSGTTDASQSYETLIEAIKANGGPTYEWTDIAPENKVDGGQPGGNIRVGFLYNPERVTLAEAEKGGAAEAVAYEDGSLTVNPGRIDPTNAAFNSSRKPLAAEFEFNGEEVIVINNHFNSKGGDQPVFGKNQPPVLGSEAQRVQIATIVNGFIQDVQTENPDANVVVMGDLNDFEFSNPIQTLKGSELTNLIEKVPAAERFTYNYQGNSQVLDHILVTNNLAAGAEVDIVHINSPFMEEHGRASDHDPVLAQLDLGESAPEENFDLTVLHTNDTHAALDNMPKTVTAVKEERTKDPNALLLHAGDAFTGTLYFNEFQGKADLDLMNLMGFDAMTFGNHEFDLGSSSEGHARLVDFIKGSEFPFVSANVDFSQDALFDGLFNDQIAPDAQNGQIFDGIIKEVNGEKVGIFGLTTEETADISSPGSIAFENYLTAAEKAVKDLEAQGVNKIIALTHIGYDDNAAIDNDLILAEKVEGIDIIVGGHSHTALKEPKVVAEDETPTVIAQTGNGNSNLGVLNVEFDENGVIAAHSGQLVPIKDQVADQKAVEVLEPYKTKVNEVAQQEIGVTTEIALENPRTDGDNTKPSVRKNETILGNLITDGMLEKAKSFTGENVIMALQNGGGIRAAIDAGPITVGEVITVLPFGNTLATMDLTGAELKEAFEISVGNYPEENGGFLHIAGGKVEFDSTKPVGERVVSVKYLDDNGEYVEVQDEETYTIATNAFTAKGGDGYDVFAKAYEEGRVTDLGLSDWENFRDHLVSLDKIPTEVEGRIVDVSTVPGEEPDEEPGQEPGEEPSTNPGKNPEVNPGKNPDKNPGKNPEENPGKNRDKNPGHNPEVNPGNKRN
ncbi:5'-nucleotidase C-terminal domain-containing protein [Mesobacillus maritimus]|uniref:5'-nucleotidase C-terminal domain-containing protein n=1 Tax=Mesobacillus maritimus TaxID=1643336 RepID=UPI00203F6835|nr:5'-nucleotidase C-terminal domain-containing protein [Mesobacillus maritimus]MCM3668115.1 5'-nucleotidase C-terminal domain-containing protein [Mesobacillus maritimus]